MSAQIIEFPNRRPQPPEDLTAIDCRNCVNARFGVLTHCVLVNEDILDEEATAGDCDAYEPDDGD